MQSAPRTTSGVLAVLVGLVGLAACGNSAPPGVTTTIVSSSTAPDGATSSIFTTTASPSATGATSGPSSPGSTPTAGLTSPAQREVNPAGDIPDNQAFVPYAPAAGKFTITVPEGWARTDTATGVLFTDKYNSIRVDTRTATKPPTTASIRFSEVPVLAGAAANFKLGDITTVSRKAGTAVLLTYQADTPPNEVTGKVTTAAFERYVFFKAGTEVLITVGAPVGGDNVDPWRKVTDSFSWSA